VIAAKAAPHIQRAGVEFTNGDQPGVRLAKAVARTPRARQGSNPMVTAKTARRKASKATEKKRLPEGRSALV